ncbi:MAG: hypothetical protein JWO53_1021 [Chlamydiia bacterium]|nr:hypothetical protein [Chlamydiia bacterium]
MKIKIHPVLLVILIAFQCVSCGPTYYQACDVNYLRRVGDWSLIVELQFIDDMRKQGFIYCMDNTNVISGTVCNFSYGFYSRRQFTSISEARAFIIKASEDLLERFNNNKSIRLYLKKYPVKISDIAFAFVFIEKGTVSSVFIMDGNVSLLNGEIRYKWPGISEHAESYETAKRLYTAEREAAKQKKN